ncbi:carboxymuconolactone decarboxylase family protein [Phenylobacterium sp. LjRoot219]|uniref:carboxymuconolactone decarboxylase family protein n=1 Tax=Phenylobacterium sp. LjRoot219 TaxID=3342283 RepID=UPI003ED1651D
MDQPPRIPPVQPQSFTDEQRSLVGDWSAMNFARVIVAHPALYRALMPLIAKLIAGSELPPRDREVLVLRTLALCDETYETAHHVLIARGAGLTDAEIAAAQQGADSLAPFDRTLARAAEELVRDQAVSDATWRALAERYGEVQLMEVTALVGGYTLMAMLTKSYGIPLEDAETFRRFSELRTYT